MEIRGKRVLVVGLARTGLAAARWLARRGAVVTVTDLRPPQLFPKEIPELLQQKIGMELGIHRVETFLRHELIVLSPGVPADLPVLKLAREKRIPVLPEVEVAGWFLEGQVAGITGTNGKTTTTVLLGKMLEASGFRPFVGGNIGTPLLSALEQAPLPSMVVCELSSFQLETIQSFRPHVAVLLNLSPNHLDRHPNFEAYVAAKARIFRNQTESDYAILNADDPEVMKLAPEIRGKKVLFSRQRELSTGVFVSDGRIRYRVRNLEAALMETQDVRLRGEFNLENVLAAAAAACVLGAEFASIRRAVREFHGVEHRLEFVGEIQGVRFYNDSKATSVDATAKALSTFDRGVHLILGGKDKGAPYAPLRRLLKDRVREVLVIGAARERIAAELSGAAVIVDAGNLENAVRQAFVSAERGDAILLAPACASFDQFENFEHRGRVFKSLVDSLVMVKGGRGLETGNRPATEAPVGKASTDSPSISAPALSVPKPSSKRQEVAASREAVRAEEVVEPAAEAEEEGLRLSTPRELEYIYEVNAEEISPSPEADWREPAEEPEMEDLVPPEDVGDEVLAFEVRQAPSAHLPKRKKKR